MNAAAIHQKETPALGVAILPTAPPSRRGRAAGLLAVLGALLLLAGAVAAGLRAHRQLQSLLDAGDRLPLESAQLTFGQVLEAQRRQVLGEARIFVDDARVRATVITPRFDEATVRDVLDDLRAASEATWVAVLDAGGRVRAASGATGLQGIDLSSSAAVRTAVERPTVDVWTMGRRVLVIALAPVRSRREVPALLLVARELSPAMLAAIARAHHVSAGLVIAEQVVPSEKGAPADGPAFVAAAGESSPVGQVTALGQRYQYRRSETGDSATAGRVVWLTAQHQLRPQAGPLASLLWMPVVAAALLNLLVFAVVRVWARR